MAYQIVTEADALRDLASQIVGAYEQLAACEPLVLTGGNEALPETAVFTSGINDIVDAYNANREGLITQLAEQSVLLRQLAGDVEVFEEETRQGLYGLELASEAIVGTAGAEDPGGATTGSHTGTGSGGY